MDKTAVRDFSPNGCFFHAANAAQRCMGEKLAFAAGASSSSPSPQRTSSKLPKNFDPTGWFVLLHQPRFILLQLKLVLSDSALLCDRRSRFYPGCDREGHRRIRGIHPRVFFRRVQRQQIYVFDRHGSRKGVIGYHLTQRFTPW